MTSLVAFLRGINLGKRRVKMAALRTHFVELGLNGVSTFIASGNVVFEPSDGEALDALESRLEAHLEERLGFFTDTLIRPLTHLEGLLRHPLVANAEGDGFTVHVIFAKSVLSPAHADAFQALETPDDAFRVREREVFWLRRGGLSESTVKARHLATAFDGVPNTARKIDTLRRLVAKFGR